MNFFWHLHMAILEWKESAILFFSFVIGSTNKNNKILMDAMEKINVTQLEIE
jgi:hypothetical protein